ncbi:hypothetical protein DID78_05375 [Candidatus Marinamargulisbacteria bacterium SCGC AG-343-D04]|nr:hypothetical protein DID78_05375 [Candidatus Marinamargulisbacteria bacterium SCGC AG-343-D04]
MSFISRILEGVPQRTVLQALRAASAVRATPKVDHKFFKPHHSAVARTDVALNPRRYSSFVASSAPRSSIESIEYPIKYQEKVNKTKSPHTLEESFKTSEEIINSASPLAKQCLELLEGADISYGGVNDLTTTNTATGWNYQTGILEGKSLNEVVEVGLEKPVSRTGEGGVFRIDGASEAVQYLTQAKHIQLASGVIITREDLEDAQGLGIKLQQAAKLDRGGKVPMSKILATKETSIKRGVVPKDITDQEFSLLQQSFEYYKVIYNVEEGYTSPQAFANSIEEISAKASAALKVSEKNIRTLAIKVAVGKELAIDINSLMGIGYTLGTATSKRAEELKTGKFTLKLTLAGAGGGSASTEENARLLTSSSAFTGLIAFMEQAYNDPTNKYKHFELTLDGMLYRGEQLASLYLISKLVPDIKIRFSLGMKSLISQGCINKRQCHIEGGCTPHIATHGEDTLPNHEGSPEKLVAGNVIIAEGFAAALKKWGIEDLSKDISPQQAFDMLYQNPEDSVDPSILADYKDTFTKFLGGDYSGEYDVTHSFSGEPHVSETQAPSFWGIEDAQQGEFEFDSTGDFVGAFSPTDQRIYVKNYAGSFSGFSGRGSIVSSSVGFNSGEASKGGLIETVVAQQGFMRLGMGDATGVACIVANNCGELARSLKLSILGSPEDFPEMYRNGQTRSDLAALATSTVAPGFAKDSINLYSIMPKKAAEKAANINPSARKRELSIREATDLLTTISTFLQSQEKIGNTDKLGYLHNICEAADRDTTVLQENYCAVLTGLPREDIKEKVEEGTLMQSGADKDTEFISKGAWKKIG